jgi:Domain of unknown function (DUF4468) with TBP-like fold
MKKTLILLILLFAFNLSYAQEFTIESKTIIGVFIAEGKTKSQIFSSINKWISLNYNSAQDVVQLNDKEAGNIIVKGINEAVYKNVIKKLYPKNKYILEYNTVKFNHTLEINIKDERYRVIYTLTNMINEYDGYDYFNDLIFKMIDFDGIEQVNIDNYNAYIENLWKKSLIGKKKRANLQSMTPSVFEEMNKGVIASIKLTMLSIDKTVNSTKKDDW